MSSGIYLYRQGLEPNSRPPFGTLDEVTRRLGGLRGFRQLSSGVETHRTEAFESFAPIVMPCITLLYDTPSHEVEFTLWGDPVAWMSFERCAPWDLLPVVDALRDLGPFVLASEDTEKLVDPEEHRARPPEAVRACLDVQELPGGDRPGLLAPRWEGRGAVYLNRPLLVAGSCIVVPVGGKVGIFDARTGTSLWTAELRRPMHAAVGPDVAILAGRHPKVFALSLADGSVLWEKALEGESFTDPVLLRTKGIAVARHTPGEIGKVYCLRPDTGEVAWNASLSEATTMRLHCAEECLLAAAGDAVHSIDPRTGELLGSIGFPPQGDMMAPAAEMASFAGTGLFLHPWSLTTLLLPALEEPHAIREFPWLTGFEHFVGWIGPDLIAIGLPGDREKGKLTVLEAPGFDVRYEIAIQASPSPPAVLGPDRWACILRPLRERRDQEAEVIVIETATGRILHREPLGCRGWYPGHVAAGSGMLFATYQHWKKDGLVSGIRAFEVRESA